MTHSGSSLSGMMAFVSGGGGAIASASAKRLMEDGAAVHLMDHRQDALEAARSRLLNDVPGGRVSVSCGDAMAAADIEKAVKAAYDVQQRLDIIVSTVGGGMPRPLLLHDPESFRAEVDLNIMSTFMLIKYGVPLMSKGGSIVCISSNAAKKVAPWMGAYCVGKAALDMLVRCAAEELSAPGIRVNAVRPGLTRSQMSAAIFRHQPSVQAIAAEVPLGRTGEPIDIAEAVRYLAGPEASWVTGQSLGVDGGLELRKVSGSDSVVAKIYGPEALEAVKRGKVPGSAR